MQVVGGTERINWLAEPRDRQDSGNFEMLPGLVLPQTAPCLAGFDI